MKDFQLWIYGHLLKTLKTAGYQVFPVSSGLSGEFQERASILLRHDVDRKPENALNMAKAESRNGIFGTYYFRVGHPAFDRAVIQEIADMGHEIGYHYENLSHVAAKHKIADRERLFNSAKEDFSEKLTELRLLAPIKTICMHGSPLSGYDNRELWKVYDYREFGIESEPYFDIDFSKVFYLTDTGRRWNGDRVSVRDRVEVKGKRWPVYRTTMDIIAAVEAGAFPSQTMITIHPQRWSDNPLEWAWELVSQRIKNIGKRALLKRRKR